MSLSTDLLLTRTSRRFPTTTQAEAYIYVLNSHIKYTSQIMTSEFDAHAGCAPCTTIVTPKMARKLRVTRKSSSARLRLRQPCDYLTKWEQTWHAVLFGNVQLYGDEERLAGLPRFKGFKSSENGKTYGLEDPRTPKTTFSTQNLSIRSSTILKHYRV